MGRAYMQQNVFEAAVARMTEVYKKGHRVVISFSGGKDSTCVLNVSLIAAKRCGIKRIEVVMKDEEINIPGTYDYAERVANRPDVDFNWFITRQPIVNCFNRENPFFFCFDKQLDPEDWVRKYPDKWIIDSPYKSIDQMTVPEFFPVQAGQILMPVIGLRTQESVNRLFGLMSKGGYTTGVYEFQGALQQEATPIYDWSDGDVWKGINDFGWDYNKGYDTLRMLGVPTKQLRTGPPTMNPAGLSSLVLAAKAWPNWFARVARRLPGVRTAVQFGLRAVQPERRIGESWEQCFYRTCVDDAPEWVKPRAMYAMKVMTRRHAKHATTPYPEVTKCKTCAGRLASWKLLALNMWGGDPFCVYCNDLPAYQPEDARAGEGYWGMPNAFYNTPEYHIGMEKIRARHQKDLDRMYRVIGEE